MLFGSCFGQSRPLDDLSVPVPGIIKGRKVIGWIVRRQQKRKITREQELEEVAFLITDHRPPDKKTISISYSTQPFNK